MLRLKRPSQDLRTSYSCPLGRGEGIVLKAEVYQKKRKNGRDLCSAGCTFLLGLPGPVERARSVTGALKMTAIYGIVGILALALLVYLFVALLKPEIFG